MANYAGAYGAGGAADALRQLIADKLVQQKFEEQKRHTKVTEDERAGERRDAALFQQQQADLEAARNESATQNRYEDRTDRRRMFDVEQQQHVNDAMVRAKERADDREAGLEGEDRAFKRQETMLKERQAFERELMGAKAGAERKAPFQWVNRNGTPVYTDQVQPGDTPQNSREQGRPVLSSDANKVTDLDVSLKDLETLRKNLPKGATGMSAQIGAALPNAATEFFGIGRAAKEKQALIDRVKQVIGKSMEGGVLRKEDEAKYARILPTIADPDEVVQAKIDGLQQAISQRREQQLENLGAAGYDVTRFGRQPQGSQSGSAAPQPGTHRVINGQDAVWDGQGWLPATQAAAAPAGPPPGANLLVR